jgi:hypothetical protein
MIDRCPYCDTPYSGELDADGNRYCECPEAQLQRAYALIVTLNERIQQREERLYPVENRWYSNGH